MFEIELISFIDYKAADEFSSLTRKEQREATLEQLLAVANAEREVMCLNPTFRWGHNLSFFGLGPWAIIHGIGSKLVTRRMLLGSIEIVCWCLYRQY